jgi:hypothetical protein
VADDVVDLARDAQALLGHPAQGLLLGQAHARLERLHSQAARADGVAGELRRDEQEQGDGDQVQREAVAGPVGADERDRRDHRPRQPRAHRPQHREVDRGEERRQIDRPTGLPGRAEHRERRDHEREGQHRVRAAQREGQAGDRAARVGDRVDALVAEAERRDDHQRDGGADAHQGVGPPRMALRPREHRPEGRPRRARAHPPAGGARRTSRDVRRARRGPSGRSGAARAQRTRSTGP